MESSDADGTSADNAADEREHLADQREEGLAAWARRLGHASPDLQQRAYESIERSRELLNASPNRLDRSEAALRRALARAVREQQAIDSEVAESAARWGDEGPAALEEVEARVVRLQAQLVERATLLSAAQDALAAEYEKLALEQPQHAGEWLRLAERVRHAAVSLRAADWGQ